MKSIHTAIPSFVLAAVLATVVHSASAEQVTASNAERHNVEEGQAVVTKLGGNAKAVTYWARRADGVVVVTTVDIVSDADTDAERHAIVRLQSVLQSGQTQEISVPLPIGDAQPVLRVERLGDLVSVSIESE
jgi:hypothetical protein